MEKISGVYKITNIVTGDFYIGSSKDVKRRWACHKCPSKWQRYPNNPMYLDMKKYGVENFYFQILEEVEIEQLKEKEQQFIEKMKPTYNQMNAKGFDVERYNEYQKHYQNDYHKSDKYKSYRNKYQNQLCFYNGEIIKLNTLRMRFRRAGIKNPTKEAKKYIIKK